MTSYAQGSHENFIAVAHGLSGWFAVMYWWNPEELGGFWEPYETGEGRYATKEEAVREGLEWAECTELEFVESEQERA